MKPPFKIIDVHVHIPLEPEMAFNSIKEQWVKLSFLTEDEYNAILRNPSKLIELLDEWNVEWINVISYYAKESLGLDYRFIDAVGKYCMEYPDRLHFVMGVNPRDEKATEWLEYLRSKYNSNWIKIHPVHAWIYPNAYRHEGGSVKSLERIYEYAESNRVAITIHTGTSAFLTSRNKYGNPIYVEDVLIDFPKLKIVLAHGGRPIREWMEYTYYLIKNYENAYLDISGIPPKYLLTYFPNIDEIIDKVFFGSDWYSPGIKSIIDNALQIMSLPLNEEAKKKILHDNAANFVNQRPH